MDARTQKTFWCVRARAPKGGRRRPNPAAAAERDAAAREALRLICAADQSQLQRVTLLKSCKIILLHDYVLGGPGCSAPQGPLTK